MKLYDSFEFLSPFATYPDHSSRMMRPLDLDPLFDTANRANMKPLNHEIMQNHALGRVLVGFWTNAQHTKETDALAYAAITGIEQYDGKTLAVVGGVITVPQARGAGLAIKTVTHVLELAETDPAVTSQQPDGVMARCNEMSWPLFAQLGFTTAKIEQDKHVMVRHREPTQSCPPEHSRAL